LRGVLYAVADYARAVPALTPPQVERNVGQLVAARGLAVVTDEAAISTARQVCALDEGFPPGAPRNDAPRFLMRWQGDVARLPDRLSERISSGKYRQAAIGACAPHHDAGAEQAAFAAYRVAVLLY